MSRLPWCAAAAAALMLVTGCGIDPSGVGDAGPAPTGVAPGPTLYFLGADGQLQPQLRETGHLGTISEALALLLLGPAGSGARTGIASTDLTRVEVDLTADTIELRVPLTIDDVTPAGIDQIVCTALANDVQAGGSARTRVRVRFTLDTPESQERRRCPALG